MSTERWNRKRTTIKDIAAAAGVDPSTVTRALQDSPRVRESTRERIRELARELGYVPNMAARTLVTRRSRIIGLVIPDITNPFFAELARGIEEEAHKHLLHVLTRNTEGNEAAEREAISFFTELKVDGLVVAMARCPADFYAELGAPLPVVHVNRDDVPHFVSCDRVAGSRGVVDHLVALGHRRIAFVAGPHGPAQEPKMHAYRSGLESAGIEYDPELVLSFGGALEDAARVTDEFLAITPRPTAIFAWNDLCAIGMIRALRDSGLEVPRDVSVAGHDDLAISSYLEPTLTTVHWPMYELGQQSVRYLYRLHEGQRTRRPPVPPPEVRLRDSTAPPP